MLAMDTLDEYHANDDYRNVREYFTTVTWQLLKRVCWRTATVQATALLLSSSWSNDVHHSVSKTTSVALCKQ